MTSLQEIFDTVATHLLTQNEQSLDVYSDACMYRGDRGLKCAAGVLIPDDKYFSAMEKKNANGSVVWPVIAEALQVPVGELVGDADSGSSFYDTATANLVDELQKIHDNEPVRTWRIRLHSLAVRQGLNSDVLARF